MKKMILGLCALVACFVFASCSTDYASKAAGIAEKISKAEKAEDFVEIMKDAGQLTVDFYKSNPTAEEEKAFSEAGKDIQKAIKNLSGDQQKALGEAMMKLMADEDFQKLSKEADKAESEWKKAQKDEKEDKE